MPQPICTVLADFSAISSRVHLLIPLSRQMVAPPGESQEPDFSLRKISVGPLRLITRIFKMLKITCTIFNKLQYVFSLLTLLPSNLKHKVVPPGQR